MGWLRMKPYVSGTLWRPLILATVVITAFQTSVGSVFSESLDSAYDNSSFELESEEPLNDQSSGSGDEMIEGNATLTIIELFRVLDIPLKDSTIGYTLGKDRYPAYEFTAEANVKKQAEFIVGKLFKNFAITVLVKPYNESGGFLFAVVDKTESVVQFGLEISQTNVENASSKISLYHTDMKKKSESFRIAEFPVPSMVGKWNTISIKVSDDMISFKHDCGLESSMYSPIELDELTFEEGSIIYIAQAGTKIRRNFVGGMQWLKIYSDPTYAEILCREIGVGGYFGKHGPPEEVGTPGPPGLEDPLGNADSLFYTENPNVTVIELFRIVDVPFKGSTIGFTPGMDGYPAFEFTAEANASKPAESIVGKLFKNFAIAASVKPYIENGGFLFAVVDKTESVVQFGLEISQTNVENASSKISLYHTDMKKKSESFRIAEFSVPSMVGKWNTISIKVSDDMISFKHDCGLESSMFSPMELDELTFEEGSIIYIAQAGIKIRRNFVGGIHWLNVYSDPSYGDILCREIEEGNDFAKHGPPGDIGTPGPPRLEGPLGKADSGCCQCSVVSGHESDLIAIISAEFAIFDEV